MNIHLNGTFASSSSSLSAGRRLMTVDGRQWTTSMNVWTFISPLAHYFFCEFFSLALCRFLFFIVILHPRHSSRSCADDDPAPCHFCVYARPLLNFAFLHSKLHSTPFSYGSSQRRESITLKTSTKSEHILLQEREHGAYYCGFCEYVKCLT